MKPLQETNYWGPKVIRTQKETEEATQYKHLERVVLSMSGTKELSDSMRRRLNEKVKVVSESGELLELDSPCDLFDNNNLFQVFCTEYIPKILIQFNKRPNQTNIVSHISSYSWAKVGWIAWSGQHEVTSFEPNLEIKPQDLF